MIIFKGNKCRDEVSFLQLSMQVMAKKMSEMEFDWKHPIVETVMNLIKVL